MHYWDFRTLEWFDWWCIFDLFEVHGINDYLALNIPLWFLLCLFVEQVMYYVISQLNRWVSVFIIIAGLVFYREYYN